MKKQMKRSANETCGRHSERGAALIMMMLIAMLLLAAGGALIMSTALSTTTVYEATPEMQAYYAAEAGLENVLTVLRGNVAPLDAGGGAAAPSAFSAFAAAAAPADGTTTIPDSQKINLRRALDHQTADSSDDPNNAPQLRLSRWLNYNYTPPSGSYPDRVALVNNYTPLTGTAFRVALSDPDNSTFVSMTTTGLFKAVPGAAVSGDGLSVTVNNILGPLVGTSTVTYLPRTTAASFNTNPAVATDLGSFRVTSTGLGAVIFPGVPFKLTVNQTAPWQASTTLNANISFLSVAGVNIARVGFQKDSLRLDGTALRLTNLVGRLLDVLVPPAGGATTAPLQVSVTAPEPKRVRITSTGLGPKGAQKILEMILTRSNLDFESPATLTMRGASDCSAPTFDTGSSGAKDYKGADVNGNDPPRPAIAVTACDYDDAVAGTKKPGTVSGPPQIGILDNGTATGAMSTQGVDTPGFLEDANKARQYLNELEAVARSQGRYFSPATGSTMTANFGTASNPMLTFVDGNCDLEGGAGMLVVTGNLNMSGNPSFDGIILVLGEGSVNRNGGGSGSINGSMVIAKFARTWPASENNIEHPFLAPFFNTNGGGNSTLQYSSTAVTRALNLLGGPRVAGVAEL
ncbi:MAG TPA: hypothetical protein VF703_01420 [Pyrinomonadaceae bacterium]|jgi:hypothetical protein